jgi:hypothetical protein
MTYKTDAKERKATPVYSGFVRYFPLAMAAVAELSRIGNDQHNPNQPLHWAKEKSTDELDSLTRHLAQCGIYDVDRVLHDTKVAWRAMANLERLLEKNGNATLGDPGRLATDRQGGIIKSGSTPEETYERLKRGDLRDFETTPEDRLNRTVKHQPSWPELASR